MQEWLSAKRNINTEVPKLKASVSELQKRQSLLESDVRRLQRLREADSTIGKVLPDERRVEIPGS